jgi:hypothetical protein
MFLLTERLIAAGSDATGFDPVTLLNYGILGVVVICLITGWLWTKPAVDRLVAEKDRAIAEREKADAQRDAMAQVLQEKLLPVVGDFISTTQALLPILQQIQQLQAMVPILQEIIRSGEYDPPNPPRQRRRQGHPPNAGAG